MKVISLKKVEDISLTKYLKEKQISKKSWLPYLIEVIVKFDQLNVALLGFKNDLDGYQSYHPEIKKQLCIGRIGITTIEGEKDRLCVFQDAFGFLSFVELGKYKNQKVIVLNSLANTSKVTKVIELNFVQLIGVTELYLNNDEEGSKATLEIQKQIIEAENKAVLYRDFLNLNELYLREKEKGKRR